MQNCKRRSIEKCSGKPLWISVSYQMVIDSLSFLNCYVSYLIRLSRNKGNRTFDPPYTFLCPTGRKATSSKSWSTFNFPTERLRPYRAPTALRKRRRRLKISYGAPAALKILPNFPNFGRLRRPKISYQTPQISYILRGNAAHKKKL